MDNLKIKINNNISQKKYFKTEKGKIARQKANKKYYEKRLLNTLFG